MIDLKKAAIYDKRNEVVSVIPSFWRMALNNHSVFASLITSEDEVLLDSLKMMQVTRDPNDVRLFSVTLVNLAESA